MALGRERGRREGEREGEGGRRIREGRRGRVREGEGRRGREGGREDWKGKKGRSDYLSAETQHVDCLFEGPLDYDHCDDSGVFGCTIGRNTTA